MMPDERVGASRCEEIREILTWGEGIPHSDQAAIADHLAGCAECAEHGKFIESMREEMARQRSAHPEPELLVRFAEGAQAIEPVRREAIEAHLLVCSSCAGEVEILDTVEREFRAGTMRPAGDIAARVERSGIGQILRRIGETLAGSILRPVPAAIYLTTAIVVMAVVLSDRGRIERPGELPETIAPARTTVGGVVLLSDLGAAGRGDGVESTIPALLAGRTHILLLEFTTLAAPPDPGAAFDVALIPEVGGPAVWQGRVRGSEFRENYTLGVVLEARGIAPGRYSIEVVPAGGGEAIFRSVVEIQPVM